MIPQACKRLAEVDFPIGAVSKHAAREKSIRHGHPSTLHLWWARRPLAACRAMLLGLLLPDPCDEQCPPAFKQQARALLAKIKMKQVGTDDLALRRGLLHFIGDFANWDLAANPLYLEVGRGLVQAAHPDEPPLVVDPFAGGGSIPLEALRLGAEAFASDLNPVACLILKVMLEEIPRHGPGLADELRRVGGEIKAAAEQELAAFYPPDADGARPIAYLWARTVQCESPDCGAEIPLMRSLWLSKKPKRRRALRFKVVRSKTTTPPRVELELFTPAKESEVPGGTVSRARATCPCCGAVLPPERVRYQLAAQRGGADVVFDAQGKRTGGARLLAVVTLKPGEQGRHYRLSTSRDYTTIWQSMQRLAELTATPLPNGMSRVPDEPTPAGGGSGAGRAFSVQRYGMMQWGDLFTARQKLALMSLSDQIRQTSSRHLQTIFGAVIGRCADYWSSGVIWAQEGEFVAHTFGRQALPIVWDFAEAVPWASASGNLQGAIDWVALCVESWNRNKVSGQVQNADACNSPLPIESCSVWFTDPPYYDAIPYSDLSDFFFVWLKRALPDLAWLQDPFDSNNPLTPKTREAVQDETKKVNGIPKDRAWFEATMARAFAEGRRVLREDGVGSVVFAHKTTEGWEALLSGMIQGGWVITGSWPIGTERPGRLRALESAALATSVHLVCRPRPADAGVGDWSEVLGALPRRVGDWIERLQGEGIRGADLVFACIGPALEIYSRYDQVVDAAERVIPLGGDPTASEPHRRGYLSYVWEIVARTALEQVLGTAEAKARNGAAGAVEEDARLTALFLWTLQSSESDAEHPQANLTNGSADDEDADDGDGEDDEDEDTSTTRKSAGGFSLMFDVVRRFAQPLGIHLPDWEARIIETKKGVVRLLPIVERAKLLFGDEGADAVASDLESGASDTAQLRLPGMEEPAPKVRGSRRKGAGSRGTATGKDNDKDVSPDALQVRYEATTLDRVHAAMLLQKSGHSNALRALLKAEHERGGDFLRLANALSALYPRECEEKRLLDAMLLAARGV